MTVNARLVLVVLIFSSTLYAAPNPSKPLEFGALEYGSELPFPHAGTKNQKLHPTYRVQVFGKATLSVSLDADAKFILEGPFRTALAADQKEIGTGKIKEEKSGRKLEAALTSGLYRLQVLAPEANTLTTSCTGKCHRPEMTLAQIRKELEDHPQESKAFHELLSSLLGKLAVDGVTEKLLEAQLKKMLEEAGNDDRFPTFPTPYEMGRLHPFVQLVDEGKHSPKLDKKVEGSLKKLLGSCEYDRTVKPRPFHELLPEFSYGHYDDDRMSVCEISQSIAFAQIMTSLAMNGFNPEEKSEVIVDSEAVQATIAARSPEELIRALIATGHFIELYNERRNGNFLAIRIEGLEGHPRQMNARIPVWIKTGFEIEGSPFDVPMGHSQQLWKIWGPLVNARVAFYLGIFGAGFHPEFGSAPGWAGTRIEVRTTSGVKKSDTRIAKVTEAASHYLRHNREERGPLKADGYYVLGVCNDSLAFIEAWLKEAITAYPLFRSVAADKGEDAVSKVIRDIPHDTARTPEHLKDPKIRKETLCRILKMAAMPLDSPAQFDALYVKQMKAVQKELGDSCKL